MYRIQTDGYQNPQKTKWVIAREYLIPKIEKSVNFENRPDYYPTRNYLIYL